MRCLDRLRVYSITHTKDLLHVLVNLLLEEQGLDDEVGQSERMLIGVWGLGPLEKVLGRTPPTFYRGV